MTRRLTVALLFMTPTALTAQAEDQTGKELLAAYQKAQQSWTQQYREASKARDRERMSELLDERPEPKFLPNFQAAAKRYAGTPEAVPLLLWLCQNGGRDTELIVDAACELLTDHIESPEIGELPTYIGRVMSREKDKLVPLVERLAEVNPSGDVKANALFRLASMSVGTTAGDATAADREFAAERLRRAAELAQNQRLATEIERVRDEFELLGVGKPAPEIEAEDLDGVAFKLSDYRGKVVMLDFWGDW